MVIRSSIYPLFFMSLGLLYLLWSAIALMRNKQMLLISSYQLIPQFAHKLSSFRLLRPFFLYLTLFLQKWVFLKRFRYLFGPILLIILICIFLYRLYQGNVLDLLWLPLSFMVTTLVHEFGHALAYAHHRIFVVSVQIGFPVFGKTKAIVTDEKNFREIQAFIGIAGSATNLLLSLISFISFLILKQSFIYYLLMVNTCFSTNVLFSNTKDYRDVNQYTEKAMYKQDNN